MNLIELEELLNRLADHRPIFHSEADFQHALAWEIHTSDPSTSVRLERPVDVERGKRLYIDLMVQIGEQWAALELKYWKKALEISPEDETFRLLETGARDLRRYDFWKDVTRLETLVSSGKAVAGYAVALTNDPNFWRPGSSPTPDDEFRLDEGRIVASQPLRWLPGAGVGTVRGREGPLDIKGRYELRWQPYSKLDRTGADFRYLAVTVGWPDAISG